MFVIARPSLSTQPKAARQAGPLPEIQAGAGVPVAEGVTRQKVLQPHRKAMEPSSLVDISQVRPTHLPCLGAGKASAGAHTRPCTH